MIDSNQKLTVPLLDRLLDDNPQSQVESDRAHHLVINRNHILVGGIKPHYYCLPVAKRESHRLAPRAGAGRSFASTPPGSAAVKALIPGTNPV